MAAAESCVELYDLPKSIFRQPLPETDKIGSDGSVREGNGKIEEEGRKKEKKRDGSKDVISVLLLRPQLTQLSGLTHVITWP